MIADYYILALAAICWLTSLYVALAWVPTLARRRWQEWATSPNGSAVLGSIIDEVMEPTRSAIVERVDGVGENLPTLFEKLVDKKLYQSAGQLAGMARKGKASNPQEASVIAVEQFLQGMGVKYPSPLLVMKTMQQAQELVKSGDVAALGELFEGNAVSEGEPDVPLARP